MKLLKKPYIYLLFVFFFLFTLPFSSLSVDAKKKERDYGYINEDNYRKTLCKGLLGKSYGAVIDGVSCDCSGYTKVALSRMHTTLSGDKSFKNYTVNARSTAAWVSGSTVSFTTVKVKAGAATWTKQKTTKKIGKINKNHTKLSSLELGDVMVYGHGSYSSHMAIYFGKFDSGKDVRDYLVKMGIYGKNDLKKTSDGKYTYNGRTIIRSYTDSKYWRIHACSGGIMIDNDIKGSSPYTSSFGAWKWTFESGIKSK